MIAFYLAHEYWFAAAQLSLAMLGMGATLTVRDFQNIALAPMGFSLGTLMQLLLVPLIAFAFIAFSGAAVGVLVGLALIASIPGGTVSNIFTYFAKGNTPLSIAITVITTIACLITTPLILSFLISEHMPSDFIMPAARIALEISVFLLLPLIIGMIVLKQLPKLAPAISKWGIRSSLFIILLIVIGSAGAGRLDIDAFGADNLKLVIMFIGVIALIGAAIPIILKRKRGELIAIQFEVTIRNTNLGLLINASLFPVGHPLSDTVLFTLLLYGALMLLISAVLIGVYRNVRRTS